MPPLPPQPGTLRPQLSLSSFSLPKLQSGHGWHQGGPTRGPDLTWVWRFWDPGSGKGPSRPGGWGPLPPARLTALHLPEAKGPPVVSARCRSEGRARVVLICEHVWVCVAVASWGDLCVSAPGEPVWGKPASASLSSWLPLGAGTQRRGLGGGLDCQSRLLLGSVLEGQKHLLGNREGQAERGTEWEGGRTAERTDGQRDGGRERGSAGTRLRSSWEPHSAQLQDPEKPSGGVGLGPPCGRAGGPERVRVRVRGRRGLTSE